MTPEMGSERVRSETDPVPIRYFSTLGWDGAALALTRPGIGFKLSEQI